MSGGFVRLEGGVLAWDGAALEMFRTDGREQMAWRVHGSTIRRWVIEPHRKGPLFYVWVSDNLHKLTILADADVEATRQFMTSVIGPSSS